MAIYNEGLDIHLAHLTPSLRRYLTMKNNNTITICTLANSPIRDPKYAKKLTLFIVLTCLKCHNFYIRSAIRPFHIRSKENLNTRTSSFHKHLIKCKNKDNNFH